MLPTRNPEAPLDLLRESLPNDDLIECAEWASRRGNLEADIINEIVGQYAQQHPLRNQDFFTMLIEDNSISKPVIMTAPDWFYGFKRLMNLAGDGCVPIIGRLREPVAFVKALRNA